jgi:hypothetical protein
VSYSRSVTPEILRTRLAVPLFRVTRWHRKSVSRKSPGNKCLAADVLCVATTSSPNCSISDASPLSADRCMNFGCGYHLSRSMMTCSPRISEHCKRNLRAFYGSLSRYLASDMNFFFNPFLFASCSCTFSKWWNTKKGVKRSAQ